MVLSVIKTYQKLSKVIKSYQKCKTSKTVNTEKQSAMTVRNGPKLPNTAQNDPKLFRITNNGGSQAPEPAPPGFETGAATFSQSENDKRDHLCRSQGCYQSHGWGRRRKHRKRKHSVHLPMSGEALARGFWVPFGFRSGPRALGGLELRIFVILGHFGGARSGYAALRCALGAFQPVACAQGRLPGRF